MTAVIVPQAFSSLLLGFRIKTGFIMKYSFYTITAFLSILLMFPFSPVKAWQSLPTSLTLVNDDAVDQDDMCFWIHPDPAQSTIISSDKAAHKVFVYDLDGKVLQTISLTNKPRNIDVRYNFLLSGKRVDIVVFGQDDSELHFYTVDESTRLLKEAGTFLTEMKSIYGLCLYHDQVNDKFYAIASVNAGNGELRQWELTDNGDGTIRPVLKRTWINGPGGLTEGMVADDETATLYTANEDNGIYKYDANPTSASPDPTLVVAVGDDGLAADIEGLTLYYAANNKGYLLASSQGISTFYVYERTPPHKLVKTFTVSSVGGTDGIDVTNVSLNDTFKKGLFIAHDGRRSYGVRYEELGLDIDTSYWNPRNATDVDLIAPAAVKDFDVRKNDAEGKAVNATWDGNSSGDDGVQGSVNHFEIRWTAAGNGPIDNDAAWTAATPAADGDADAFAQGAMTIDMSSYASGDKLYAIRTYDEAGNISPLEAGSFTVLTGLAPVTRPDHFHLYQNYPNPFNPGTHIQYNIPGRVALPVDMSLYNTRGQKIRTLIHAVQQPGTHMFHFDASGLPAGIYFYQLTAGAHNATKKLLLLP
ncbi:MAG: phytase [Calditrichaeota bacterium]|nr:MAG: phytase [Calditrichota bacterium]